MALYQPYPLITSNTDYGQVVNSSGDPVFGEFLSWFSQSSGSSTFYSYSSYLRNALTTGAFVSRFHNAQIRQLDAGINYFRQQTGYGEAYNLSLDPTFQNLLSNTAFMLSNLNARVRRIDQTLDGVFHAADLFSSSTLTDNYINDTFWPSTFSYIPPLTQNPVSFAINTYVGDANVLYPLTTQYMNVEVLGGTSSYAGTANQIIFSVTNSGLIKRFGVQALGAFAPTIGTGIFTSESSYMIFSSNSFYDIASLSITGNFVATVTFLSQYSSTDFVITDLKMLQVQVPASIKETFTYKFLYDQPYNVIRLIFDSSMGGFSTNRGAFILIESPFIWNGATVLSPNGGDVGNLTYFGVDTPVQGSAMGWNGSANFSYPVGCIYEIDVSNIIIPLDTLLDFRL